MRFVTRALMVVLSAAIAWFAWQHFQTKKPASPGATNPIKHKPPEIAPIAAEQLIGMYQGPVHRVDGSEEWLVLDITAVTLVANGEVTFRYTLSSSRDSVRNEGRASLREAQIRFSGFSGEIRTRDDGTIILRSRPIDGPPEWILERPRATAKTS